MARSLHEHLRELADRIEAEERADHDAEALRRIAELEQTARGEALSEEDRELLTWARQLRADLEAEQNTPPAEEPPAEEPPAEEPPAEEPPARQTRPGRRSGQAYDYTTDEDGRVVRTGMAHIYSGPDEPDEVELPADEAAA